MSTVPKKADVSIGSRICFNGSYGTIRYCGEIQGKHEKWYGVDWDDSERGKHNGTFAGIKYFTAKHPTSGSFIDPSKVDTGRSLAAVIEQRYIHCYESLTDADRLLPQKSRDRMIDFVGAEKVAKKISQIQKLRVADVRESRISYVGDVLSLFPNLTDLDLSTNLISDWRVVVEILGQLPCLTTLDLSGNRLRPPKTDFASHLELTTLVLNGMELAWKDITTLAIFLSNVQSLALISNGIHCLDMPLGVLQNLNVLDLSQNQITSWDEAMKLGHLPKLSHLILATNNLNHICISEKLVFPNLKILNLSNNQIGMWKDIAELSKLQKLERLLLAKNPVLELQTPQDARQLVIAKIRTLQFLDAVEITRQERKGAEWDYIKRYWPDWQKSPDEPTFEGEHPSLTSLIKLHGAPEISGEPALSVEKIPVLTVSIYSPLIPEKLPVTRKIPANIIVGKLKQLIKKWFQINENNLILSYKTTQEDGPEYSITNDTQFLSFYAIANGDQLCVRW